MIFKDLVIGDVFEKEAEFQNSSDYHKKELFFLVFNNSPTTTALKATVKYWYEDEKGRTIGKGQLFTAALQPGDYTMLSTTAEIVKWQYSSKSTTLHYSIECDDVKENYIAPRTSDFAIDLHAEWRREKVIRYTGNITNNYLVCAEIWATLMLKKGNRIVGFETHYYGEFRRGETKKLLFDNLGGYPDHDAAYIGLRHPAVNKKR